MKNRFSRTELSSRILIKRGQGKNKDFFVEQILELQKSPEDGRIEFEGRNGIYVFEKKGNILTFKLANGLVIRKKTGV